MVAYYALEGLMVTSDDNVVRAFSEEHVERLTGITRSQLRYWDRTGFFSPSLADEERRQAYSRVYSFRDVVCLQVLNTLRNESRVTLPHLREVKEKLAHLGENVWAKTTLYVLNRKVHFVNPETDEVEEVLTGQGVLQIPLKVVQGDMEKAVRALWKRNGASVGRIRRRRGVASSQPVIAGTRIPVRAIKAFHAAGYTVRQICEQYPDLTEADVKAALGYDKAA